MPDQENEVLLVEWAESLVWPSTTFIVLFILDINVVHKVQSSHSSSCAATDAKILNTLPL